MSDYTLDLLKRFCEKCRCELVQDNAGLSYILRDSNRKTIIYNVNDVVNEALKLQKIHKLENKLKDERNYRKRRKILNHLYFIDNCQNSSSGRAVG